jgi:glycosyltransferase involved in cell wall biosynthesis
MRILFLSQAFVRHEDDAIGSFIFRLAEEVAAHGDQVTVLAPHAQGLPTRDRVGQTDVLRFRYAPSAYERLAYHGDMHRLVLGSPLNMLLFGGFLAGFTAATLRAVRQLKPDVLHAHWWFPSGLVGAVVSRLTGVPLVVTCHGTDVALLQKHGFLMPIARRVFAQAVSVTTVSRYLRQQIEARLPELAGRVAITPMPVNRIFSDSPQRRVSGRVERKTIVAAGRLSRQKGFHDLIAAGKLLHERGHDVKIVLVGEGPEEQALRDLASRLDISDRVVLAGVQTASQLAETYRACDAFVLPSEDEGLGLVLIEAMLCGAPVVGARSGGICDTIADSQTGLLVEPGDAEGLAQALAHLFDSPTENQRMALAGRAFAQRAYSPDACVGRVLSVYRGVLRRRASWDAQKHPGSVSP